MTFLLTWDTLLCLILYILLLPFYIYGFSKWYQWRTHILFRLRHSYPEGLFLVIVAFLLVHSTICRGVLKDFNMYSYSTNQRVFIAISLSLISMIQGTIYYRATLTFLAYQQHQARLCQMGIDTSTHNFDKTYDFNSTPPRKRFMSRLLFIVYVIVSFSILILRLLATYVTILITNILLTFNIIVAVVLYIIVKKNKVRELIGCLFETYITFASTVVFIVLTFTIHSDDSRQFAAYIVYHLWGLSTLYFTIYFIYKARKTFDQSALGEVILTPSISLQPVHSEEVQTEDDNGNKTQMKAQIEEIEHDIHTQNMKQFLCNQKNYEIFSKYLAYCFCLENLMFVQRICVFRWLVIDKMHARTDVCELAVVERAHSYYSLQFRFVNKMYKEYNELIEKDKNESVEDAFKRDRVGLWKICNDIYHEFVAEDSINQVNIPQKAQLALKRKLGGLDDIEQNLKSYQDFLDLFEDVTYHVWILLKTVYEFRFATYLKHH